MSFCIRRLKFFFLIKTNFDVIFTYKKKIVFQDNLFILITLWL